MSNEDAQPIRSEQDGISRRTFIKLCAAGAAAGALAPGYRTWGTLARRRAGWTPDEDILPARFLSETLAHDDAATLRNQRLQEAVSAYNEARGWTSEGWPTEQSLDKLGLQELSR